MKAIQYLKYPEYGFSLARICPYKDRFEDSFLIKESMNQRKPVTEYIF